MTRSDEKTAPGLRSARIAGAVLGAAVAAMILIGARVGAGVGDFPAAVRVSVPATGELAVEPSAAGAVIEAPSLSPGLGARDASFELRNQSPRTVGVGFEVMGGSRALDEHVMVSLEAGGMALVHDELADLREGTGTLVNVRSGATLPLEARVWIPAGSPDGYQGHRADLVLQPLVMGGRS